MRCFFMLSNVRSFLVRSLLTLLALNTLAQSTAVDTGNFDPQFTNQAPVDSPTDALSGSVANVFDGFTYGECRRAISCGVLCF